MATSNQRREAARRQLEQQLAQRQREQSTHRGRMLFLSIGGSILVVILAVVLIAVLNSSGEDKNSTAAAGTSAAASAAASASSSRAPLPTRTPQPIPARDPKSTAGPCKYAETAAKLTSQYSFDVGLPPDPNPTPTAAQIATFTTNLGVVKATLDAKNAPCNVQAIAYLIQQKFYDGTACPRSANADGFAIIQCGDPTGTSQGGPTFTVKDENLSAAKYTAGTIAMANGGADTNSGQFFFIPKDSTGLGPNYTVIGHVTEGLDTLVKVANAGDDGSNSAGGGRPNTDFIFNTVTVS